MLDPLHRMPQAELTRTSPDLSRYFGGDVLMDTVQAHSVEWDEAPGKISSIPVDESIIPEQERIPRLTSATW